jgi:putative Holliday junction resolvase
VRVLALDLGSKRVGVAISDPTGILASPLTTIHRRGDRDAEHREVAALVGDEGVGRVIVGLPLNMNGSWGPAARAAKEEAEMLSVALKAVGLDVPVDLVDERLTTVAADRLLIERGKRAPKRRQVVDRTAAALLLQGWLDGAGTGTVAQ